MKATQIIPLLVLSTILFSTASAQQDELIKLRNEDQEIRQELVSKGQQDTALIRKIVRFDSSSTKRLKELLGEKSWFTKDAVGSKGLEAAFILLQHSPDYGFQKSCLPYIEKQAKDGDLDMQDYALLLDRTLIHDNKPQVYGTQIKLVNDEWTPYPIEDSVNVDKRRSEIGLFSMKQYLMLIKQYYKKQ